MRQVTLRIPEELHELLADAAAKQGWFKGLPAEALESMRTMTGDESGDE